MNLNDAYENSKIKARVYLQDSKRLASLQGALDNKIAKSKSRITEGLNDIYTLMRLLAAYATGEYRQIAFKSMVAVVAALIYFLNPMDLIPDIIATVGFLDDLTILAFVIKTFKEEIDRFVEWEMEGKDVENDKD